MERCLIWSQTQRLKAKCLKWRTSKRDKRWNLDFFRIRSPSCMAEAHRQSQMDAGRRASIQAAPWHPLPWGPNSPVLRPLFKSGLSPIHRSDIRREKSWIATAMPSPAFTKPMSWPARWLNLLIHLKTHLSHTGFQAQLSSLSQVPAGLHAGKTWVRQLVAPSLTCLTTWSELKTTQIQRRPGYF